MPLGGSSAPQPARCAAVSARADLHELEGDPPARGWVDLVRDPRFGWYLLGRLSSNLGVWIANISAAVLMFELTRSAFLVGLVSVAQFLPQLVLGPLSGAAADRGDRKRQVLLGRVLIVLGTAGQALWLWLADVAAGTDAAVLVTTSFVIGLGFVTGGPAMHAIVPALVRRSEIASAVTLDSAPVTIARAVGPAVGTAIALAFGAPAAFLAAAALNLIFIVVLLRMEIAAHVRRKGADLSVRAGVRFLRADRPTALLLLGVTAVGFGSDPAITLAPSISASMGQGSEHAGTFASAFGIGAGLGFVVIALIRRVLSLSAYGFGGMVLMALGLVPLTIASSPGAASLAYAASGLGMTLAVTSLTSQLQQRLPDDLRGRIMALWSVGFIGSRPLAAALDGAIADLVSVPAALITVVVVLLVAAWLCLPRRLTGDPPTDRLADH